jgi:hypothetical protein
MWNTLSIFYAFLAGFQIVLFMGGNADSGTHALFWALAANWAQQRIHKED